MKYLMKSLLVFSIIKSITAISLSLDGSDWRTQNQNQSISVGSRVPGSIFTDLLRANVLKEDPYYGFNDFNYRWVSHDNWTFFKTFNVDQNILIKQAVYLVCHGIDTVSKIYINDILIGATNNMFVRYKFDIKKYLHSGQNSITVGFESAVTYAKRKHDEQVSAHYIIPPECTASVQQGECHPNYIRKMQASFSWDWGPSFPTQGIWKHIEIEAYDSAIIRDITVNTISRNNHWILNTTIHLESTFNSIFQVFLQFSLYDSTILSDSFHVYPSSKGNAILNLQIPVNDSIIIHKWYPNGMGAQMLYKFKVDMKTISENMTKVLKIGFRTIELIEDQLPNALTFYFKVNGLPMFSKGSNWIPAHVFQELLTEDYIRYLLQSAKDANMNMLRVWGGGVYEDNVFYEIADEYGILIWQDFMFACALYPTDDHFMESVAVEVSQQVRRLQHHPSILLWAGNNENEAAIAQLWWPEILINSKNLKRDYVKLYIENIREIVLREDMSRPYLPSSPSNGNETMKEGWLSNFPQDNRYGDVHYYYYGSEAWDWKRYPSTKFASEYGFQSYPSLQTLSKALNPLDLKYPLSDAMTRRQHHGGGDGEIENSIKNYMNFPISGGIDRLNDLIYLSQIAQAMSIKTETEFYRRNRELDPKNGEGFTMGALYWQLNDIWQAPTWAGIEFGGKWKIMHYYAKNMFENLLISPFEDQSVLNVAVVRDDYSGILAFNLTINVYKWSSMVPIYVISETIITSTFSARIVYHNYLDKLLSSANCFNRSECLLELNIENSEKNLKASNFMLLSAPKNAIGLKNPNITITDIRGHHISPPNYIYDIVIQTNAITPFVWLDFRPNSTIEGIFSDNGFIMFNNQKLIQFYGRIPVSINILRADLIVKSLTDVKSQ